VPDQPHIDERKSASPRFSPGLVSSNETVFRTILDPDHLEPDGKLRPAAISLKDIQSRGWSVDRKRFTSLRQLRLAHAARKRKNPLLRKCYVLPVGVRVIREPDQITGVRNYVVTDTALWRNPAHASVLLSAPHSEGTARGLRNNLLKNLPPYVELESVFDSGGKLGYVIGMFRQTVSVLVGSFRSFLQK
jgi:hypothetical protein